MTYPYQGLQEFPVKNKVNLFQTGLAEMAAARNILNTARRILSVQDSETEVVLVGEHSNIVKLVFNDKNIQVAYIYFIPATHRIDIYDSEGLVAVYERKRCLYSRCTEAERRFGFENLFKQLVSFT